MRVIRQSNEPPPLRKNLYIRRVKVNAPFEGIIVSPAFYGVYVHWGPGRSIPCYEDKSSCAGHRLGYPVKWYGYLHVVNGHNKREEFLEVPNQAALDLLAEIGEGGDLRGTRVKIKRGQGEQTRFQFELQSRLELVAPKYRLPDPRCPDQALRNMWGINEVKLRLAGADDVPDIQAS